MQHLPFIPSTFSSRPFVCRSPSPRKIPSGRRILRNLEKCFSTENGVNNADSGRDVQLGAMHGAMGELETEAVFWAVVLGDQPPLRPGALDELIEFAKRRPGKICQPGRADTGVSRCYCLKRCSNNWRVRSTGRSRNFWRRIPHWWNWRLWMILGWTWIWTCRRILRRRGKYLSGENDINREGGTRTLDSDDLSGLSRTKRDHDLLKVRNQSPISDRSLVAPTAQGALLHSPRYDCPMMSTNS